MGPKDTKSLAEQGLKTGLPSLTFLPLQHARGGGLGAAASVEEVGPDLHPQIQFCLWEHSSIPSELQSGQHHVC